MTTLLKLLWEMPDYFKLIYVILSIPILWFIIGNIFKQRENNQNGNN